MSRSPYSLESVQGGWAVEKEAEEEEEGEGNEVKEEVKGDHSPENQTNK